MESIQKDLIHQDVHVGEILKSLVMNLEYGSQALNSFDAKRFVLGDQFISDALDD